MNRHPMLVLEPCGECESSNYKASSAPSFKLCTRALSVYEEAAVWGSSFQKTSMVQFITGIKGQVWRG